MVMLLKSPPVRYEYAKDFGISWLEKSRPFSQYSLEIKPHPFDPIAPLVIIHLWTGIQSYGNVNSFSAFHEIHIGLRIDSQTSSELQTLINTQIEIKNKEIDKELIGKIENKVEWVDDPILICADILSNLHIS